MSKEKEKGGNFSLARDMAEGRTTDQRGQLPGFEREPSSVPKRRKGKSPNQHQKGLKYVHS